MPRTVKLSLLESEKLIELIRTNPVLYDVTSSDHKDPQHMGFHCGFNGKGNE